MKKINLFFTIIASAFLLTSCVKDLDTMPLNETDETSETAYDDEDSYLKGLAYINAYYSFVSQNDPGSSDIAVDDAGQSELIREYINMNELSCDSFKCTWGDPYVTDIQSDKWTSADNAATIAVYTRCMKGIALANEYLIQTESDKLSSRGHSSFQTTVNGYRAEARFHRAMFYWMMMDLFGNPPFAMPENIGGDMPTQISRADLYQWLDTELNDLLNGDDMPDYGEVPYPRPTKGSVAGLLARMYLNAEVYTGTAQMAESEGYGSEGNRNGV